MPKYTKNQVSFAKLKPEQFELTFSELLGFPNKNELLVDVSPVIHTKSKTLLSNSLRNILMRNNIINIWQLSNLSLNAVLKIQSISLKRLKEAYEFYAQYMNTNQGVIVQTSNCRDDIQKVITTYSMITVLEELITRFIPNSDLTIRGVVKGDSICDGKARIAYSNIPIYMLVSLKIEGATDAEILKSFPMLTAIDLSLAWLYYQIHQQEIKQDIREFDEK